MQILDFQKNTATIRTEHQDDLWHLSQLIEEGDIIKGKTERKIKKGAEGDRKAKIEKKTVFLEIQVEKLEFSPSASILRASGKLTTGTEDVSAGSYHSFSIDTNTKISIKKAQWYEYQRKRIKEACASKKESILICIHDREQATFALLKPQGIEILSEITGEVEKKAEKAQAKGDFYAEIAKNIADYSKRHKTTHIVLASPAFFKENVFEKLDQETKKKTVLAACSATGKSAIQEIIKREEVRHIIEKDRLAQENSLIEKLLEEISKEGKAVYGIIDTKKAGDTGAISILLLTDSFIREQRAKEHFQEIESVMKLVEQTNGKVHILSSEHDPGIRLNGLGGIAAILRYQLSF